MCRILIQIADNCEIQPAQTVILKHECYLLYGQNYLFVEGFPQFHNPLFLLLGFNFYYVHDKEGMKIFVISRKNDIRGCKNVTFKKMRKINDFTFIDEER